MKMLHQVSITANRMQSLAAELLTNAPALPNDTDCRPQEDLTKLKHVSQKELLRSPSTVFNYVHT